MSGRTSKPKKEPLGWTIHTETVDTLFIKRLKSRLAKLPRADADAAVVEIEQIVARHMQRARARDAVREAPPPPPPLTELDFFAPDLDTADWDWLSKATQPQT